jgi:hypothetical protein
MSALRSDQYESLRDWAQKTLGEHARDNRLQLRSITELERTATRDRLRNAARRQLVAEGPCTIIYLRMVFDASQTGISSILGVLDCYDWPWGPRTANLRQDSLQELGKCRPQTRRAKIPRKIRACRRFGQNALAPRPNGRLAAGTSLDASINLDKINTGLPGSPARRPLGELLRIPPPPVRTVFPRCAFPRVPPS